MTLVDREMCTFEHEAFIYGSDDAYAAALVPVLEGGVAAGAPVFAVVPPANAALLRDGLGPVASDVAFIDADHWYERPHATAAHYDAVLRELDADHRAVVIGEVRFGTTEREWAAWTRYEAALNAVLAQHQARVICPYDTRVLPGEVVDDARRTHPFILDLDGVAASAAYVEPGRLLPHLAPAAVVPVDPPAVDMHVVARLAEARRSFAAAAAGAGRAPDRVDELTVAVNEVITNSVVHGGGAARLRIWVDGPSLTCVVDDEGPGVDDPLVGYRRPDPVAGGGYGVWLARQLFDRSELLPRSGGGLTVVLVSDR